MGRTRSLYFGCRGGSSLAATPSTASYRTINELSKSNDNGQSSIRDVTRSPDGQRTPFMLAGVDQDATSLNNKKPLFAYHLQECSWESCDESNTSQDHLEIHAINARNKWSPNSKCTWEGCLSKALFAKLTKYNHHLMNIHTEPLICSSRGCSYKKPFRNQNDLDRHWITAHAASTQVFECPYKSCEQPNRTFVRKDKWLQHIREVRHLDDAFCPYFHCSLVRDGVSGGFNDRKAISRHFSNVHDAFQGKGMQCGLASCGKEDRGDFWAERGLESHLDLQHGIRCQWKAIKHMREALRRVFLVEDLADSSVDWYDKSQTEWHDCSICSPQDQPEKFTTKHTKWYPRS